VHGAGKTYLACALAQQAWPARPLGSLPAVAPRLFDELALARPTAPTRGSWQDRADSMCWSSDDWGLAQPRETEKHDLLEVLEDRCGNRATINDQAS